jgi:OOP family OmpA-OmpF porin
VTLGVVSVVGSARAEITGCSPKVDNFVLFVDQSGSMYQTPKDAKEVKEVSVKKVLSQMNDQIPQLGYKGGLTLFAPFATKVPVAPYSRPVMGAGITSIPDDQPVYWRMTPMGQGLGDLNGVLAGLHGKTAVVMFSDGEQNEGPDPVATAQQLVAAHPDLCIHVVSFADSAYGIWVNLRVSSAGKGCRYADGPGLLADAGKMEQFVRDVFCGAAAAKQKIVLRGVNFDFDKAVIRADGKPVLDAAIQTLKEQPDVRVSVEGHTDSVGSDAYNQRLSERRAQAVADYLAAGGIARSRMSARGYGESKPVASNATDDGRAQNRRVELGVISK